MPDITDRQLRELRLLVTALAKQLDDISDPPMLSEAGKSRVDTLLPKERCLFCAKPYGDEKVVRGVHFSCYNKLDYKFRRKKKPMAEKEAISRGWLLQAYDNDEEEVAAELPNGPIVGKPTAKQREETMRQGKQVDDEFRSKTPKEKPRADKPTKGGKS